MREVIRSALIGLPPERLYALISDIERYPEFVPGCTHAHIEERREGEVVATLGVQRRSLNTQFTTRNSLEPPHSVTMQLVRGPFKTLEGVWTVRPVGESGCEVSLRLRFEFSNPISGLVFTPIFEETAASLVDAFVTRARALAERGA